MQTVQMKLQRILMPGCLALAGCMVLYALGFSTNLYALSYHVDAGSSFLYVPGAELYIESQPFNRLFFTHVLYYFLLSVTLFLTLTHRRRLYYVSNYIASVVFAAFSVFLGGELIVKAITYRQAYWTNIDFERMKEVTDMLNMRYVESSFMLDVGIVLSVLLFLTAGALLVNLVLKTCWMRREHWLEEAAI